MAHPIHSSLTRPKDISDTAIRSIILSMLFGLLWLLVMPTAVAAQNATDLRAAGKNQHLRPPESVPDGLTASDWHSIRAAYEAGRHAFQSIGDGWQARNPGQQWLTRFDRRGFEVQPQGGAWSWGLDLQSYGFGGRQHNLGERPAATLTGQRLTYRRDGTVHEWYVNDSRGLEQASRCNSARRPAPRPARWP